MTIREVQRESNASIGHVGLALITEMTRVSGLDDLCREAPTPAPKGPRPFS